MHDAISAEIAGIPAVGIMTDRFVSAAELMASVLGVDQPPMAVIAHPISSATANQLADEARSAAAICVEQFCDSDTARSPSS